MKQPCMRTFGAKLQQGQEKNSWSHILKLLSKKINITELEACVSVVKSSFYEIQRRAAPVTFFW